MENPIQAIQDDIINEIHLAKEGDRTFLDVFVKLRGYKKQLENTLAMMKEFESDNYQQIEGESGMHQNKYGGLEIRFVAGRKSFDFKHIEEWVNAKQNLKDVEEKYKSALNAKIKGSGIIATEDGEELEMPVLSYGAASISVKKAR